MRGTGDLTARNPALPVSFVEARCQALSFPPASTVCLKEETWLIRMND
jgi:hypothetical protein